MRTTLLAGFVCLAALTLKAQNIPEYSILSIPDTLRANAGAVIRDHSLLLDIASPGEIEARHRAVYAVLNERGLDWTKIVLPYDRFTSLHDVRCVVYDALGVLVKKYDKKDFQDIAYLDQLTMAEDGRYLLLDLSGNTLPFTFELSYTQRSKSALFCPDYLPQPGYHVSVEHSRCRVQVPAQQTLLYKNERSPKPEISRDEKFVSYAWTFEHLAAIPDEPYNLPIGQLAPAVRLNLANFEIDGFSGSFTSWDGFARWNQQMVSSLSPLSKSTVREIRQLTEGLSEKEKIRAVYRFLQNNTRYISIQLGIGGWKPFDPNFVHDKKYGDCKALSWYTRCLLEAAGIPAYYTLVYAGDTPRELDPGFPNNAFNHVVVTVPTSDGDTTWLECTAQTIPFGYTGTFTGNRKALAIDGEHAQIVHIPAPPADQNNHVDSVRIQLLDDGKTTSIRWNATYTWLAIEDDDFYAAAFQADPAERKKWIDRNFKIKGGRVESFELGLDTAIGKTPAGRVGVEAVSTQLLTISPTRIYFQPNFFQPWTSTLTPDSTRISPVFRRFGHTYTADLEVRVPLGWSPESLPAAVEDVTAFGKFSRTVSFSGGVLNYRRSITLEAGTFPKERYGELVAFFKKMKKWDGESAVFVQKS